MELPTKSPLLERVFSGIPLAHAVAGTKLRMLVPSRGRGGRILWLRLALGYFLMARSDELFATDTSVVHQAH